MSSAADSAPFDVVGIGSVVIDHQVVLPYFPEENAKVAIASSREQVGGPVPTALVLLSRWGQRCAFVGRWAADAGGRRIEQDLTAEGVDWRFSTNSAAGATGFAQVWIARDRATRTIATARGAGADDAALTRRAPTLPIGRVLHLDGILPRTAAVVARATRAAGGIVCLDAGSPKPGLEQLLPHVSVMVCPQHFMRAAFDTDDDGGAGRLRDAGVGAVIVTRGADGASLYRDGNRHDEPALPVDALDTTGAGDVFCGALIYGMLHGWAWPRRIRWACVAAALKCMGLGNRDALPRLDDVTHCM